MVNEALKPLQSGTCLRAIKLPFTKRMTIAGVVDSILRKAVSDLLRFPAAIVAGSVNDFGLDRIGHLGSWGLETGVTALVSRIRSSRSCPAGTYANFGFKGTSEW